MRFVINPAASSVQFFLSAAGGGALSLVTTVTTNIPTAINLEPFFQIRKTAGATALSYDVDYAYLDFNLTTLR
jgi:hypothetical protein